MQSVQPFRTIFFSFLILMLAVACKKKNISDYQKIIGTWKSTQTVTQVYENGELSGSYLLQSDQKSFSKLTFDSTGHFRSSGQYATREGDSLTMVILSPQKGNYRIIAHKLITTLENINKSAELTICFKNNELTLITKTLTSLDKKKPKQFIAITTYRRER